MNENEYIIQKFNNIGIDLSDNQVNQFYTYYKMLVEKNKVMNLTAITEFEDVVIKHFVDSVLISKVIDMSKVGCMIDVGTGAGFPGVPIKIVYPDIKIVLMDSLNKRVKFLNEVSDELKLCDIEIIHSRAEDLSLKEEYREKFDLVVSRAVANLSTLSEYCIPFVKVGGAFVSYKADNIQDEIDNSKNAVKILGSHIDEIKYVELDENTKRSFVIIQKDKSTSKKYPRKAGVPSSSPL